MSQFINAARDEGKNERWMYILGTIFSFLGGQFLGALPLVVILLQKGVFDIKTMTDPVALGIDKNIFLILMLLPFIVSFIILWIFIKLIHKKKFIVSFTPFEYFDWKKFVFAFIIWFAMSGLYDLIFYFINPSTYEYHGFAIPEFLGLIAISLFIIPIQTTFEELLFRSYLMQGIGQWKPYRMIPLLITSLAFGLIHIANPEVGEYGYLVLIQYIGIGFLLGLLTILSDSTEFSIGLHAANNIYGCIFVSFKGSALSTDSLFYAKEMKVDALTIMVYLSILVIFFFIIKMKYKLLPLKSLVEKFEVLSPKIEKWKHELSSKA